MSRKRNKPTDQMPEQDSQTPDPETQEVTLSTEVVEAIDTALAELEPEALVPAPLVCKSVLRAVLPKSAVASVSDVEWASAVNSVHKGFLVTVNEDVPYLVESAERFYPGETPFAGATTLNRLIAAATA